MFDFNWVTLVLFNKARFQKSWPNRLIRCVKHEHGLPLLVRISDVAIFGISESVLRIVCPTKLKDKWFMLSGDLLKGVNRMSHYSASRTTYSWKLEFQLRVSQQFRKAMRSSFYIPKLFINMLCQLLPGPNIIYKSIVGYMTMKSKTLYEIVTPWRGTKRKSHSLYLRNLCPTWLWMFWRSFQRWWRGWGLQWRGHIKEGIFILLLGLYWVWDDMRWWHIYSINKHVHSHQSKIVVKIILIINLSLSVMADWSASLHRRQWTSRLYWISSRSQEPESSSSSLLGIAGLM